MTDEEFLILAKRQCAELNEDVANGIDLDGGPSLDGPFGLSPDSPYSEEGLQRVLNLIHGVEPTEK